jgi:predicted transcriptional regulator
MDLDRDCKEIFNHPSESAPDRKAMNLAQFLSEEIPEVSPFKSFVEGFKLSTPMNVRIHSTDHGYISSRRLGPKTELVLKLLRDRPNLCLKEIEAALNEPMSDVLTRIYKYDKLLEKSKERKYTITEKGYELLKSYGIL